MPSDAIDPDDEVDAPDGWDESKGASLPQPLPVESVLLEIRVGECPSCMEHAGLSWDNAPIAVRILTVDMQEFGWRAKGEVLRIADTCDTCGMLYTHLVTQIPIEFAEYPCPKCGSTQTMSYEVVGVNLVDQRYEFVAQFSCSACRNKGKLRKLLKGLQRIKRLKLGPGGVEIEQADRPGLKAIWRENPFTPPEW